MQENTIKEGKLMAIVAHLWIIGTIIALIVNLSKKNAFTSFYVRQMIGLHLLSVLNGWIIYEFLGGFIKWILGAILFVFWLISFSGAVFGNEKLVPLLGGSFQRWFKNI